MFSERLKHSTRNYLHLFSLIPTLQLANLTANKGAKSVRNSSGNLGGNKKMVMKRNLSIAFTAHERGFCVLEIGSKIDPAHFFFSAGCTFLKEDL